MTTETIAPEIRTTDDVIAAIARGPTEFGRMFGMSPQAVNGCRSANRGTFPPNTFLAMSRALEAAGIDAPASLWRMRPAAETAA